MFSKVLIANRGAIACRVIRTLKKLGIASVAVYSEADANSLHVSLADEAVCIGPAPAAESYLKADTILEAARATGAQGIHPGYGFLSENPDFSDACEAAGIAFIGPTRAQMLAFGLKHTARELAEQAGVPLLPGSGLLDDVAHARLEAARIGYPVMLKSTAGGGGIGMRLICAEAELDEAYASVDRLARANFKEAGIYLEKYVTAARHIEVQVFGDGRGRVLALGERDCSVQRRNQKVIEETPAPGLTAEQRASLAATAVRLMESIAYRSAGTVVRWNWIEGGNRQLDLVESAEQTTGMSPAEFIPGSPLDPAVFTRNHDPAQTWDPMVDYAFMKKNTDDFMSLWRCPKPTIARVQGACVSGAFMMANMCDLMVASDDAYFADPVVHSLGAASVEILVHPWVMGLRRAKEMLFTGVQFRWKDETAKNRRDDLQAQLEQHRVLTRRAGRAPRPAVDQRDHPEQLARPDHRQLLASLAALDLDLDRPAGDHTRRAARRARRRHPPPARDLPATQEPAQRRQLRVREVAEELEHPQLGQRHRLRRPRPVEHLRPRPLRRLGGLRHPRDPLRAQPQARAQQPGQAQQHLQRPGVLGRPQRREVVRPQHPPARRLARRDRRQAQHRVVERHLPEVLARPHRRQQLARPVLLGHVRVEPPRFDQEQAVRRSALGRHQLARRRRERPQPRRQHPRLGLVEVAKQLPPRQRRLRARRRRHAPMIPVARARARRWQPATRGPTHAP